jgi:hypothetical protein
VSTGLQALVHLTGAFPEQLPVAQPTGADAEFVLEFFHPFQ